MTKKQLLLFAAGLACIALTMRAPITAVGPLAAYIQEGMGLSASAYGILTTIPLLAFAAMSVLAGRIGGRYGSERLLFAGLAVLLCGVLLRSLGGNGGFFAGTVIIGVGISFSNVLLPVIIKERAPHKAGQLTGLYTACMGVTAGLAGAVSVPLARLSGFGWRGSLAVWAGFVALALLLWIPQLKSAGKPMLPAAELSAAPAAEGARRAAERRSSPPAGVRTAAGGKSRLSRSAVAWQITLAMGLQSLMFYSMVAFMPTMLASGGMTFTQAGFLVLLTQITSPLGNLLLPVLFQSPRRQTACIVGIGLLYSLGFLVLLLCGGGAATVVGIGLCGVGMGASLTAVMCLIGIKTRNGVQAAALSGMSQAVGYLLAAAGPVLLGSVFDASGSWTIPLLLLLCADFAWAIAGLLAVRNRGYAE